MKKPSNPMTLGRSPIHADVAVIGGGPAGAPAAALLASWGYDVALITRPAPPAGWLGESIPASARKLFDAIGMLPALDGAGLQPNGGNTVWWAGGDERRESFRGTARGVHAERAALERALLEAAAARGVRVYRTAPVRRVSRTGRSWLVEWGAERLEAGWLLDSSGRAGVVARADRIEDPGAATLALVGRWRRTGPDRDADGIDATHTLIESYEDGWVWSVPLSDHVRCVCAMVDPRRTDLRRGGDLEAMLLAEIAKTRHVRNHLERARRTGPAHACPATLYSPRRYASAGLLLVGDAGSFIDPLSSYGVKKALASAWLASVACNTALRDASATDMATSFYHERERTVYQRYRALSLPFFEAAAAAHGHAFWTSRVEAARAAGSAPSADDDSVGGTVPGAGADVGTGALVDGGADTGFDADPADRPDPAADADALLDLRPVRETYEEIRRRRSVDLREAGGARRVDAPSIEGHLIVLAPHLVSPRVSGPVRYVRNVDLCRLVAHAPAHDRVPDIYEAYNASGPPAALPDFLAALAAAVGVGFLELSDWRPGAAGDTMD